MNGRRADGWRRDSYGGGRAWPGAGSSAAGSSAARIARGVAAGFFAAACPVPGLHVGIGLIAAWVVRGNKLAAIFPLFLWNPATCCRWPIVQFKIGAWLWPAHAQRGAPACSDC